MLDASPAQLAQDRLVADREGLTIRTVLGDMADLSAFTDGQFQMIFHPCSNTFAPGVRPVWQEAFRVLRPGGVLLAGFCNPVLFVFDDLRADHSELVVRHARCPMPTTRALPTRSASGTSTSRAAGVRCKMLEDQIGGQLDAGFVLTGLYEDQDPKHPLSKFLPAFIATRAVKTSHYYRKAFPMFRASSVVGDSSFSACRVLAFTLVVLLPSITQAGRVGSIAITVDGRDWLSGSTYDNGTTPPLDVRRRSTTNKLEPVEGVTISPEPSDPLRSTLRGKRSHSTSGTVVRPRSRNFAWSAKLLRPDGR